MTSRRAPPGRALQLDEFHQLRIVDLRGVDAQPSDLPDADPEDQVEQQGDDQPEDQRAADQRLDGVGQAGEGLRIDLDGEAGKERQADDERAARIEQARGDDLDAVEQHERR